MIHFDQVQYEPISPRSVLLYGEVVAISAQVSLVNQIACLVSSRAHEYS